MKIRQKLSTEGRFLLPLPIRKKMNLKNGDDLLIDFDEENLQIVIKKDLPHCICCGSGSDIFAVDGIVICKQCINKLKNIQI